MLQNIFNLVKEQKGCGLFCVRGFTFSDKFVRIVLDFDIKLFFHCLITFGFQKNFYRSLINTPTTF